MEERAIESVFKHRVHVMISGGASDPDGFLSYFAGHEARDEEILGLLAISPIVLDDCFPTPFEALAAPSSTSRSEICREFRELIRTALSERNPA